MLNPRIILLFSLLAPIALTTASAQTETNPLPAPIAALQDRGATIGERFDAPDGLSGYTVSFQGQTLTAYVTANENHVVVGTLLDGEGTNLSEPVLEAAADAPRPEAEWDALEASTWIRDGSENAERVIYAFSDPNCPFCHRFYEQTRSWIEADAVQIRHVMVGVLREDSLPKAATLLAAEDPAAALAAHEAEFDNGGVTPADQLPAETQQAVQANNQLMAQLGIRGTPSVFYRDEEGAIRLIRGLPRGDQMTAAMGGAKPE